MHANGGPGYPRLRAAPQICLCPAPLIQSDVRFWHIADIHFDAERVCFRSRNSPGWLGPLHSCCRNPSRCRAAGGTSTHGSCSLS
jgi:hypothetical protein